MQACSDLARVVLVGVRHVTVVNIGYEGVFVVIHFCVAILFLNCCIRRCSLYSSSDHYMSGLRCFIFHEVIHVVFPSLGWSSCSPFFVFVDLMSPSFHSVAFLVHLSGLWVAIRKACRHFSFFCVSTKFVMLYVVSFSPASFSLLSFNSIQSAKPSSWLAVLASSSSNEILLSWSYSVSSLISSS